MLMPKKDRIAIYEYLTKQGVMVAEKDFQPRKMHPALKIPNLHVIKALQSLKSRGYVKEQFSWRHYYWFITNNGISYLRDYLNLPEHIIPDTLKRPVKPENFQREKYDDSQNPGSGGRDTYRRDDGQERSHRPGYGRGAFKPQYQS